MNAREIKKLLKENGIETKGVSVRVNGSIRISINNPMVDSEKVEYIVKEKYEVINRCEATGDILQGANTFVICEYRNYEINDETKKNIREFVKQNFQGEWHRYSLANIVAQRLHLPFSSSFNRLAVLEALADVGYRFKIENMAV